VSEPVPEPREQLFSGRFLVMCGFSFSVFLSAFMLLPTAPFHILDEGGSELAAGLFLGFLTYSSAFSAPITGALADHLGKRRLLISCSLALAGFSVAYAVSPDYRLSLGLVLVHGVFWSALLSASVAYMTGLLPEARRAEGLSYWGIAGILAIATAPQVGLWLYRWGWAAVCLVAASLNLVMALIASQLWEAPSGPVSLRRLSLRGLLEWRVLLAAITLFLCTFGYGAVTSFVALYADANQVSPRGFYFLAFALVMVATRPILGSLADRRGHRNVFIPCLVMVTIGLLLLAGGGTRPWLLVSALFYGVGYGSLFPVFIAYAMTQVAPSRRGAAFGAMLAAFDTGIGTGSVVTGWLIQHVGFARAFGVAGLLASFSVPYFLFAERRFLVKPTGRSSSPA
jgi:MFS family permease